jgi:hypothetical protein
MAFTMPNFSSSTLTKGARQVVVHEALEMMGYSCLYWSALTPITKVGISLPLAGAVISPFFAPACVARGDGQERGGGGEADQYKYAGRYAARRRVRAGPGGGRGAGSRIPRSPAASSCAPQCAWRRRGCR